MSKWVDRENGNIKSAYSVPQEVGQERLDDNDVELQAFLNPPPPAPPTDAERIDNAFPQTDMARVIFEIMFEMANEIRALKDPPQTQLTKAQFKTYLKTKLP